MSTSDITDSPAPISEGRSLSHVYPVKVLSPLREKRLVILARSGRHHAREALSVAAMAHIKTVATNVAYKLRPKVDTEDFMQSVALKLLQLDFAKAFHSTDIKFRNFVTHMAKNMSLDLIRFYRSRPTESLNAPLSENVTFEDFLPSAAPTPEEHMVLKQSLNPILNALADLPTRQSDTFLLRFMDYDTNETAHALHISPGTVKTHLARAKKSVEAVDPECCSHALSDAFKLSVRDNLNDRAYQRSMEEARKTLMRCFNDMDAHLFSSVYFMPEDQSTPLSHMAKELSLSLDETMARLSELTQKVLEAMPSKHRTQQFSIHIEIRLKAISKEIVSDLPVHFMKEQSALTL